MTMQNLCKKYCDQCLTLCDTNKFGQLVGVYGVAFSCDGTQLAVLTPNALYLNSISKLLCNNINVQ